MYYTIKIPFVPPAFHTEWHPTEDSGPFKVLQRGAFPTIGAAITWARQNLEGTPYTIEAVADVDAQAV